MKDDCYNEWWIFYHLPSGTGSISSVGSTVATGSERQKRKVFLDTWPPGIVFFFLKHVFGQSFRDKFSWSFLWIRQTNEYQARTNILHEVWKERNLPREIKVPTYRISLSKRLRFNKRLPRINRLSARPWYQTSAPSGRFPLPLTPPLC